MNLKKSKLLGISIVVFFISLTYVGYICLEFVNYRAGKYILNPVFLFGLCLEFIKSGIIALIPTSLLLLPYYLWKKKESNLSIMLAIYLLLISVCAVILVSLEFFGPADFALPWWIVFVLGAVLIAAYLFYLLVRFIIWAVRTLKQRGQ